MSEISHILSREIQAADVLKEHLREIAGDDVDLIRDTLEGETSLRSLIARACTQVVADGGMVNGIAEVIKGLSDRKDRIERRIAMTRAAIMAGMQTAELRSLETPAGTLSLKSLPPTALILDEAAVPSEFWKPQEPKLDKKAVLGALKDGQDVPGAQLSNGGQTLSIRN